ncbi:MAG: DUF1214 domain-containing protein [Actinomycetota bacterium]|nr:DUF1214 domain-containing protein [Actinomycetota bacterium]
MAGLPSWTDQVRALEGVGERLVEAWRPDGASEVEAQDMTKLALSILASGYMCHVYTDAHRPVFMPLWNYACNQGGPNPDYVYLQTEVDPEGTYQISGFRGTNRFVEVTQGLRKIMSPRTIEGTQEPPVNITNDLDELHIGDDGRFSVILSGQRPAGYEGDWWPLDPRCGQLLMRKCACDWVHEVDARVAINRLDDAGSDMTPEDFAHRFGELAEWIDGTIRFDMQLVRYYREHHGFNVLLRSKWIQSGGGLAVKQAYYDGIHRIDDDEALIVEFPVPTECRYWQILVADDRFATVDWVNHQSSLNDVQARVDPDGVFRAVVSRQDPGVWNWLDKAHWPWGILQARFYQANDYPETKVTKVAVADVRSHLPANTTFVTPDERVEQLRSRREGAQLRRIW